MGCGNRLLREFRVDARGGIFRGLLHHLRTLRAVDDRRGPGLLHTVRRDTRVRGGIPFLHGNLAHFLARDGGDVIRRDALIDHDVAVVDRVIVDDGCLLVHGLHTRGREVERVRIGITETIRRDEREVAEAQAEFEANRNAAAAIIKAVSVAITRVIRQRRPAAVTIRVAPAHPRRRPQTVGRPQPAVAVMLGPAAVVKRCPAPRIVRLPIPADVGIQPPAAIAVRPPRRLIHRDARLPAPAQIARVHPRTVGREGGVELRHLRGRRRRVRRGEGLRRAAGRGRHGLRRGFRIRRRGRGGRGARGGCVRVLFTDLVALLEHRRDERVGNADVRQEDDFLRGGIVGNVRFLDERLDHVFAHARLRESHHVLHTGGKLDRAGVEFFDHRRGRGRAGVSTRDRGISGREYRRVGHADRGGNRGDGDRLVRVRIGHVTSHENCDRQTGQPLRTKGKFSFHVKSAWRRVQSSFFKGKFRTFSIRPNVRQFHAA